MTILIQFAGGAMGRYTTSHNKVGYIYGNDPKGPDLGHQTHWAICGTKGLLRIDGWHHRIVATITRRGRPTFDVSPDGGTLVFDRCQRADSDLVGLRALAGDRPAPWRPRARPG